jgi:hypothetical protein
VFCLKPVLYAEQTGASVKIHERALKSGLNKNFFQPVEKHGPARPRISPLSPTQFLPPVPKDPITLQHGILCVFAEEHFAYNGFQAPEAALLHQIHTLKPSAIVGERFQDIINFPMG